MEFEKEYENEMIEIDNEKTFKPHNMENIEKDDTDVSNPEAIKWDYCIVIENYEKQDVSEKEKQRLNNVKNRRDIIWQNMQELKLTTAFIKSTDGNLFFLLITARDSVLEKAAEDLGIPMRMKKKYGGGYNPYKKVLKEIYQPFNQFRPEKKFFSSLHRIRIIKTLLEDDTYGAKVFLDREVMRGTIKTYFPLHEQLSNDWLYENWVKGKTRQIKSVYEMISEDDKLPPTAPPRDLINGEEYDDYRVIDAVKDYFGEDIGIYFSYCGYNVGWMIFASAVGLIALIVALAAFDQQLDTWPSAAYSVFLSIWATWFLEFWKRKNAALDQRWGMSDYENTERPRAVFDGERKEGFYAGSDFVELTEEETKKVHLEKPPVNKYYSYCSRATRMTVAFIPIVIFICAVVICAIALLTCRLVIQRRVGGTVGGAIGSAIIAISVIILNQIYNQIAILLNRMENHVTETAYNDNLAIKTFLFQFVNSYTSFYYIAFFKRGYFVNDASGRSVAVGGWKLWGSDSYIDTCQSQHPRIYGCMPELTTNILITLLVNMIVSQFVEFILPIVLRYVNLFMREKQPNYRQIAEKIKNKPWEIELDYVPNVSTFDDYNELIIQYGYLTLFAASLPVAPILVMVNCMVELKTDGLKYLRHMQRPNYRGAQDIGVWYYILEVLGVMAVITNGLLIGFSGRVFETLEIRNVLVIVCFFILFEHTLLVIKFLISFLVPDSPGKTRKNQAKQRFLKEAIIDFYEDDQHSFKRENNNANN
eukprot:TRINITY_DN2477_c0_g1_i1.p1 TRINITY_DN2477_c0_g1~~TRINITY_DN2477_c0_g1_i1.p1  ORF type:complete len:760 (+),score=227.49 TRINITY_DN2477_c0_g1_i1:44-2323(+)